MILIIKYFIVFLLLFKLVIVFYHETFKAIFRIYRKNAA